METSEISRHQVAVFQTLRGRDRWLSSSEVADLAGVRPRTARDHLRRMVNLGLVDLAEVFPGHRYRLSPIAAKRNLTYLRRLEQAEQIFDGLMSA